VRGEFQPIPELHYILAPSVVTRMHGYSSTYFLQISRSGLPYFASPFTAVPVTQSKCPTWSYDPCPQFNSGPVKHGEIISHTKSDGNSVHGDKGLKETSIYDIFYKPKRGKHPWSAGY
jgi:hypothetical protein